MSMHIKEIEIPVPWGHVAGKAWGDDSKFPVIVLHGILDNCGSFDRLIPLLPNSFYYICLDLPGHGKSSHFQDGMPLEFMNYVVAVKYVVDYFNLDKIYIMGHSLGAQITIFFSSIYPEYVIKVICLDGIIPEPIPVEKTVERSRLRLDNIYDGIPGKNPPSYTFDEALDRLWKSRYSEITEESARTLIKRALTESSKGYRFSSDQRLKNFWRLPLTLDQIKEFVMKVQSPLLLILAKETYGKYIPIYGEKYVERLESLLYGSVNIRIVTVDGNHDVHLNYPERVAGHVTSFLLELKSHI